MSLQTVNIAHYVRLPTYFLVGAER
jgi:hypothetical protein